MVSNDMNKRKYYVYILAHKPHGAIYIGVTNDLAYRVQQHRLGQGSQHTAKYRIFDLVYWEDFQYVNDAIAHEKKLKKWDRPWKDELIAENNPNGKDLYEDFCGDWNY